MLESMSSEESVCAVCDSPLTGGVCAVCLLGVGLEEGVDDDPGQVDLIAEQVGEMVGRYLLIEKAGEGGFGVVFRAEQQAPIRREVAVKIIKPGMDTVEVVTRFEAERQALAMMSHPHIAKVYDAGTTPRGRPYFVMEYVEGFPLTEFCDHYQLPMRERLELFADVCRAVQHAHQKGIIHRDLKPGNVLVSRDEHGGNHPKVIDFGVAKAISIELTDKTFFTVFGRMMGTPQYMSPEQTDLNAVDVDTRSDIYSLGVLLYELVTGHVPIDGEKLTSVSFDEMRKIIREEDPPKPSVRVASLEGKDLDEVAESRGVDGGRLRRYLAGDLDWVVMKALEKDRGRRYETSQGLANDVTNFLGDLPVTAGPPGAAYRMRKFTRRHRVPVLVSLLAVVVLLVGSIGITKGFFMVREEKNRTEEEKNKTKHAHQKLLVEGVWNWREDKPGSRESALAALGMVGGYVLGSTGLDEVAKKELIDGARDAMLACMLWTDLHEQTLWEDLGTDWAPAALDAEQEQGVIIRDGTNLEVRDVETGQVLAERPGVRRPRDGMLRMSRNGKLVAVATEGSTKSHVELLIWDWEADQEHVPDVIMVGSAFDFHPDGESYAVGSPLQKVEVFARSGELKVEFSLGRGIPTVLRYRPDGKAVAVGYQKEEVIMDGVKNVEVLKGGLDIVSLETGMVEASWPDLGVSSLAWAPDGKNVAVGLIDGGVALLEVGSGEVAVLEQKHRARVEQITWSHDGRLIASGCLDEIRLWDGRQRLLLCDYSAWARTLAFSADDKMLGPVTPDGDGHDDLVVLAVDRSEACWAAVGHPGQAIVAATWALDGAVLVTGAADGLRFWNRKGAALAHEPSFKVSSGGLVGRGGDLYLAEEGGVSYLKLSAPKNRLIVEKADQWSVLKEGGQIVLSPKGDFLAVAHGDEVVLFDLKKGAVKGAPLASLSSTAFVTISPDGNWLAAGTRGGSGVRLWDLSKAEMTSLDLPVVGSAPVAFYPKTSLPKIGAMPTMLLTGDSTAYRIWLLHPVLGWVQNSEHANEMATLEEQVATMVFSPRGTVAVTCFSRKYLQILHSTKLTVMAQPKFDKQWPLTMSPDEGRILVTEATDGRMFLWNLEVARQELAERGLDWEDLGPFDAPLPPTLKP